MVAKKKTEKKLKIDMKCETAPDGTLIFYEGTEILTRPFRLNYPDDAKAWDNRK